MRVWTEFGLVVLLLAFVSGPAFGEEKKTKLTDDAIEKLSEKLAKIGEKLASRRIVYFDSDPPPAVRSYLEGLGIDVAVMPTGWGGGPPFQYAGMPATTTAAGGGPTITLPAVFPSGTALKATVKTLLTGVRDLVDTLTADTGVEVEGFNVNIPPAGAIRFKFSK